MGCGVGNRVGAAEGHTWEVNSVSFSADGRRVVSGRDKTVRVWDAGGMKYLGLKGTRYGVFSSISLTAGVWCRVVGQWECVWDAVSGECVLGPLEGTRFGVFSVDFADGRRVVSGSRDNTVRVGCRVGECKCVIEGTSSMPNDIRVAYTSAVEGFDSGRGQGFCRD